jgi:hypothetical protein
MDAGPLSLVEDCEASPQELLDHMMKTYGRDWVEWEPETIWRETRLEKAEDICIYNKNKIQAVQLILSNDRFWKEFPVFENVCLAFNNVPPRFDLMEEITPGQMAFGVRAAYDIRRYPGANTPGKDPVFSLEVKQYVATKLFLEGLVYAPPPLDFSQKRLDSITGMGQLAKKISSMMHNPDSPADETPEGIGAARAAAIYLYAHSGDRKPLP